MAATEAQKKAARKYYSNNKEKCQQLTEEWKFVNPDRVRLHSKRVYNKKHALLAGKAGDLDKMIMYTKRYLELGQQLGI